MQCLKMRASQFSCETNFKVVAHCAPGINDLNVLPLILKLGAIHRLPGQMGAETILGMYN